MSNQLSEKKPKDIKSLINSEAMREQFARALPQHLSAERFARIAITATTRTPALLDCTPASVMQCLLDLSSMGLEPDGRRAHLIPFKDRKNNVTICTLIVDYKGLVELIRRSGDVKSLRAETVCEKDFFSWENGKITHSVNWRESRGEVQAIYAVAEMKDGDSQSVTMTREEVDAIMARSQGYIAAKRYDKIHPWMTDWAEMAKKTAVRRLSKMLPLSSEIMDHVSKDDDQFRMRDVTPTRADPKFILPEAEDAPEPAAIEEPEQEGISPEEFSNMKSEVAK